MCRPTGIDPTRRLPTAVGRTTRHLTIREVAATILLPAATPLPTPIPRRVALRPVVVAASTVGVEEVAASTVEAVAGFMEGAVVVAVPTVEAVAVTTNRNHNAASVQMART